MSEREPQPFSSLTLEAFLDALASAQPAPGGGSASAVVAALGASLVTMVAALSGGRPAYAPYASTHVRVATLSRELRGRLVGLADEDAAAYGRLAAAMKLPRSNDEEKAFRGAAIRAAARSAAEVPLRTLEACRDLLRESEALAGRSNRNAASDLAVASRLIEAAAHGAAENVLVNLSALGDASRADALAGRVGDLLAEIEDLAESTRAYAEAGEPREPEPAPEPEGGRAARAGAQVVGTAPGL
jgi:formiminotetrahydrofolate cyclodeaminase